MADVTAIAMVQAIDLANAGAILSADVEVDRPIHGDGSPPTAARRVAVAIARAVSSWISPRR
jgi:hypothetical protein